MGSVRVIGGRLRGFRLSVPSTSDVRPTSGRVRQALFDLVAAKVEGARALDLFAGTGALGIEALSRGASACVFVERDKEAVRCIRRNLQSCGLASSAWVLAGSLPGVLARTRAGGGFDLIFVDPPYDEPVGERVLDDLAAMDLLRSSGCLVFEHRKSRTLSAERGSLVLLRSVRYGDTILSLYGAAPLGIPGGSV